MLNEMRMSLDDVLKCGSSFEMSPLWAVISSRFWVVCAAAVPPSAGDSAAAVPATAADFRSSRLVSWLIRSLVARARRGPGLFLLKVPIFSTVAASCQEWRAGGPVLESRPIMLTEVVRSLYRYNTWANTQIVKAA